MFIRYTPRSMFIRYRPRSMFIRYRPHSMFIRYRPHSMFIRYRPRSMFILYRPHTMCDGETDYSDPVSQPCRSVTMFSSWLEFTLLVTDILLVIALRYFMPATARVAELFSESPERLPLVRPIFVFIALVSLLSPLLSPTSHPVDILSFRPSTHTVAKPEGRRLGASFFAVRLDTHTHIQTNVSPVFGYISLPLPPPKVTWRIFRLENIQGRHLATL
jgi:hypothetical protein